MLVKASGAKGKADTEHIAREMRTLIEYMKTEGADMDKAQGLAETIAGEILDSATYRNTELWQQYPEYHELTYTVNKSGQAKLDRLNQKLTEAEALGSGEAAEKLRDRLRRQIRETEGKTFLPMTVEQLQLLKAITAGTLHVIRTENKTVSLAKTEAAVFSSMSCF